MKVFLNLLGIVVVIGLIFLISWDRKNIRWKAVGKAIIAQFVIAILLVKVPVGKMVVSAISDGVSSYQLRTEWSVICIRKPCRQQCSDRKYLYRTDTW